MKIIAYLRNPLIWVVIALVVVALFNITPGTIYPTGWHVTAKAEANDDGSIDVTVTHAGFERSDYYSMSASLWMDDKFVICKENIPREWHYTILNPPRGSHVIRVRGVQGSNACHSNDMFYPYIWRQTNVCPGISSGAKYDCIEDTATVYIPEPVSTTLQPGQTPPPSGGFQDVTTTTLPGQTPPGEIHITWIDKVDLWFMQLFAMIRSWFA